MGDSFTIQDIDKVFRSSYSYSNENPLEFNFGNQEDANILEVRGEGLFERFVLAKIVNVTRHTISSDSVIRPKFLIKNKNGENYGAYKIHDLDQLVQVHVNDIQQLTLILKKLSEIQSQSIIKNEVCTEQSEFIVKPVILLNKFKDIEEHAVATTLEVLQASVNKLLQSKLVVSSDWLSTKHIYISANNNKVVFLQTGPGQLLPPVCDAFTCIFSLTTEKFRQHNLENLLNFYFQSLISALKNAKQSIVDCINEAYIETQTNTFLPVVKLAIASNAQESEDLRDLLFNIERYLKYPEINQEDVYHAIKTKLSSSDYDLLNYSLKRMTQNNGHLGDYFHLEITVKFQGKEEVFKLFAKILNNTTDTFNELIEKGLGKKEKFCYITLNGLFTKYGLTDLMDFAPKCYMSGLKGIILDDLTNQGYTSLKPDISLNYDGLKIILEKLAKFHACTFIIEELLSKELERKVRLGDEYSDYLEEAVIVEDGSIGNFMYNRFQSLFILFEKVPELTKNINLTPKEIQARLNKIRKSLFQEMRTSPTIRNVINHGDMYVSNMLFKLGKSNDVLDGILVDFQILRYLPPAYEVQFFINVCSSREAREKYQKLLQDEYYDNVCTYLRKFNINPDEIYSRKSYDMDLQNTKSEAILMSFCYGVVLFANPEFREEIMHVEEKMKYYLEHHQDEYFDIAWKSENYRNRLTGIVESLLESVKTTTE